MKRFVIICALLAGCSDDYFTTTKSVHPSGSTVVYDTPEVNPTASIAEQYDIGRTCGRIARQRGTEAVLPNIAELRLRSDFTETELDLIANGRIAVGMSERAGVCALGGNAIAFELVRTVTTPGHIVKTFVFKGATSITLVTDNGVVTAAY